MKAISWNVNGLRACARKGFLDWLGSSGANWIGVQEVRANYNQLTEEIRSPQGYVSNFVAAERPGYSGVAMYALESADEWITTMGEAQFDEEGRMQLGRWGQLWIANVYFPNGSGKNRDNSRIPYKLNFYRRLFEMLEEKRAAGEPIVVMGDFNTAHCDIDLARPKQNRQTSGFRSEEREELHRWLSNGWTDTFRHFYPDKPDVYTWWSNRKGVRERNVGWRIDYILASQGAMPFIKGAFVSSGDMGSDHCPIGIELDSKILG